MYFDNCLNFFMKLGCCIIKFIGYVLVFVYFFFVVSNLMDILFFCFCLMSVLIVWMIMLYFKIFLIFNLLFLIGLGMGYG